MWMFTAVLFIITEMYKHSRRPSVGEWINKLWYIQTVEYYSALKGNSSQTIKRHGGIVKAYY